MKRLIRKVMMIIPLVYFFNLYMVKPIALAADEELKTGVLPFTVAIGYEKWQVNWNVEGFSYDDKTNIYNGKDYKIEPAIISGVFISSSSKNTGQNSWNFSLKAYGDYVKQESENNVDSHAKYIRGFLSYGISNGTVLLTQYQHGLFHGQLVGNTFFDTEFKKMDMLLCGMGGHKAVGFGLRYLSYNMPVEYAIVDHKTGKDLGHVVYKTDTKGISIAVSSMDPIVLGYDNNKLFFLDYDFAFGASKAKAKEFKDNMYGFQFNTDVEAGVKKAFHLGPYGLVALKLGYRVFFDAQILAEGDSSDNKNTTSTLRNFFHGPFVTIVGAF